MKEVELGIDKEIRNEELKIELRIFQIFKAFTFSNLHPKLSPFTLLQKIFELSVFN
jgi:hypothetical protein